MTCRRSIVLIALVLAAGCRPAVPPAPAPPPVAAPVPEPPAEEPKAAQAFEATAYSIEGETASGSTTRKGIVAADPKVLPIGTRIRVSGAGQYDGEYVVTDTGRAIKGREIDIYIADYAAAKKFGRKQVRVEVLARGNGRHAGGGSQ
jgi:3D (Asp-Asp-Asp) domain-containing protein